MKSSSTTSFSLIAGETVLVILISVFSLQLSESQSAFEDAVANERHSRQLKEDILQLRSMESVADESKWTEELSNSRIIQIAAESGMREDQVASIQRLTPIQIEKTDYQQDDIAIEFRSATMQELILFGLKVEGLEDASKVTRISLRDASTNANSRRTRGDSGERTEPERWNAELILTQIVFTATRASR